jgi:hypothetical protein
MMWIVVLGSVQLNQVRRAHNENKLPLSNRLRVMLFFRRIPMRAWLIIKISRGKRQFHLNHPSKLHARHEKILLGTDFSEPKTFRPTKGRPPITIHAPLRINMAEIKSFTSTEH